VPTSRTDRRRLDPRTPSTRIVEIQPAQVIVERQGVKEEISSDAVFLLTGYHPDADLFRRAGIRLHRDTQVPEFNPETFETNVPGLFLAGGAICGKDTSNIFIENGRFHGETITGVIAERLGNVWRGRGTDTAAPDRADGREQRAYSDSAESEPRTARSRR
jgi:pyruvate/2-oxoglutarate dehydrogenase complex dihydrolipoamide dehydrogenase (E3) component